MLQLCAQLFGLGRQKDSSSRRNKEFRAAPIALDTTSQSKDISVRIVHAGGREELYQNEVSVSQLMEKYPGMCVARPEVFKKPHESLLWPEENLLPGQKYYMIPTSTAKKLKRKQHGRVRVIGPAGGIDMSDARITWDTRRDNMDEPVRSAKEFYDSKERWSGHSKRRSGKAKKPFVPPLPKGRIGHGSGWEPSLNSVQEVSP